jgi:hypothetical protein
MASAIAIAASAVDVGALSAVAAEAEAELEAAVCAPGFRHPAATPRIQITFHVDRGNFAIFGSRS